MSNLELFFALYRNVRSLSANECYCVHERSYIFHFFFIGLTETRFALGRDALADMIKINVVRKLSTH